MKQEFNKILPLVKAALIGQKWPTCALYMVATPIGNLADISLRALYVLDMVDTIACEDTRHTQQLLTAYGIKKNLLALHQHNEAQMSEHIIDLLQQGQRVAYVSDAGTPAVSDPGARLAKAVLRQGLRLLPIPGASSVTALLSVAGLTQANAIVLQGFLPTKSKERADALQQLQLETKAVILLEAPHRIEDLAKDLQLLGERELSVGRELTKQFEEVVLLKAKDFLPWLQEQPNRSRGEFVLLIHQKPSSTQVLPVNKMLQQLIEHLPTKLAAQLVAQWTGQSKNTLYQQALQIKKDSGESD